jgi:hypothetical protein
MSTRHPWVGLVVIGLVVVAAVLGVLARRRHRRRIDWDAEQAVANVELATASPVFRRMQRRYRRLVGVELALLGVAAVAATVLLMRPVSTHAEPASRLNRDVMLCLDVSGSMAQLDAPLLDQFERLADQLAGERIGLTIWNGSAVTIFPLTDDADYVRRTLRDTRRALEEGDVGFMAGTHEGGSSLIGDGLASCALRFDRLDEQRSRSMVLATDNALAGAPIMTLGDAARLAREREIQVYAVAPDQQITEANAASLRDAVRLTGGAYFAAGDDAALGEVVTRIRSLQASRTEQPPDRVTEDRPAPWLALVAAATIGAAITAWGLRR